MIPLDDVSRWAGIADSFQVVHDGTRIVLYRSFEQSVWASHDIYGTFFYGALKP